jgi:glutamate carboxypeptidase
VRRARLDRGGKRADVALDFRGLPGERPRHGLDRRRSSDSGSRANGKGGHSSGIFARVRAMARSTSWRGSSPLSAPSFPSRTSPSTSAWWPAAHRRARRAKIRATATGKTNIIPEIAIARGDCA